MVLRGWSKGRFCLSCTFSKISILALSKMSKCTNFNNIFYSIYLRNISTWESIHNEKITKFLGIFLRVHATFIHGSVSQYWRWIIGDRLQLVVRRQRRNSWTAFLVEVSGHKLDFFSDLNFRLVVYPHFSILRNANSWIDSRVSCFADFCIRVFKTREEYDFL
jgi:hypothetical protein